MKKIKNSLILLLVILIVPVFVMGCKPKVGADESAKALFNFVIKGQKDGLSKMGAQQKQLKKLAKTQKDQYMQQLKAGFTSQGLTINNKQVENIYNSIMVAFGKVSVTTNKVSEKDKTAQVKVKTTYFDLAALSTGAANKAVQKYKGTKITDRKVLMEKLSKEFINNLVSDLKKVKPSNNKKEETFKFVIEDNVWVPADEKGYGEDIMKLVSGQQ
ncbi:DUF5105 domain-containing protein [Clostridium oryzae]|uniref:DUF5105 domain-containing protein n=1 Tax=Clostridium oryzae TaxID=1450648 RepID=A0A1V4IJN2_9CLOT|nr:DUF5105 domain-containing protein [Clostridium oryzae]OPJ59717.1 hypothetical protein CLORY_31650 [Clostridium oryzae]